jgi:hypothetical protein
MLDSRVVFRGRFRSAARPRRMRISHVSGRDYST